VVIDECMSAWEGKESFMCNFALPHTTKIPRKPRGIGCELKSLADCETMILLRLEIMEGKEKMSTKRYVADYGATPALVKRMTEHLQGTNITVIGDSAFSSVKTAGTLLEMGLHFLGCVKTAYRNYPMSFMKSFGEQDANPAGSHIVLKTTVQAGTAGTRDIFAVGWKDSVMKAFVCTRGTTLPGNPSIKYKYVHTQVQGRRQVRKHEVQVAKPRVVEEYFDGFSAVDIHDHYRQGSLAMEESWCTKTWWHRLFSSLFGMIVTDAYFAYKSQHHYHATQPGYSQLSFSEFVRRLCYNLIFGMNADQPKERATKGRKERQAAEPDRQVRNGLHATDTPFVHILSQNQINGQQCDISAGTCAAPFARDTVL
jgi:hypothetical protein